MANTSQPLESSHMFPEACQLFFEVSSFMKFLLEDKAIKEEIMNKEKHFTSLINECDSLISSLQLFKNRAKKVPTITATQKTVATTTTTQKYLSCDLFLRESNQNYVALSRSVQHKLKDMLNVVRKRSKDLNNLKLIKPYYCFICNVVTSTTIDAEMHTKSKKHKTMLGDVNTSTIMYQCEQCGLIVIAPRVVVNYIAESYEHRVLDNHFIELIEHIKENKSVSSDILSSYFQNKKCIQNDKKKLILPQKDGFRSKVFHNSKLKETVANNSGPSKNISKMDDMVLTTKKLLENCDISVLFVELNSKLRSGAVNECFYCLLCKEAYFDTLTWLKHRSSSTKHLEFMNDDNEKRTIVYRKCERCSLEIVGDISEVITYLKYHSEENHNQLNGKFKHLVINENENSLFDEIMASDRYAFPSTSRELHYTKFFDKLLNRSRDVRKSDNTESSKMSFKSCSHVQIFILFLKEKREQFLVDSFTQFKGLCLVCQVTYDDYCDWINHIDLDHLEQHDQIGRKNIEKECSCCNIVLYGNAVMVENELWNMREHVELDALVKENI